MQTDSFEHCLSNGVGFPLSCFLIDWWSLCDTAGFQHDRRVRLYDTDNNWRLRKDVEARMLRWTITDTCISPDQKFLLYSSISPIVHLVSLAISPQICKPQVIHHVSSHVTFKMLPWLLATRCMSSHLTPRDRDRVPVL